MNIIVVSTRCKCTVIIRVQLPFSIKLRTWSQHTTQCLKAISPPINLTAGQVCCWWLHDVCIHNGRLGVGGWWFDDGCVWVSRQGRAEGGLRAGRVEGRPREIWDRREGIMHKDKTYHGENINLPNTSSFCVFLYMWFRGGIFLLTPEYIHLLII